MASGNIFAEGNTTESGKLSVSLDYAYSDEFPVAANITLTIDRDGNPYVVATNIDFRENSVTPALVITDPVSVCLLVCFSATIVPEILRCLFSCDRDAKKFIACLKAKGLSMGADALDCLSSCTGISL